MPKSTIWGISIARWAQWQHLPYFLSGLGQELDKLVSRLSQVADAMATRQRRDVQKDSTTTRKIQ